MNIRRPEKIVLLGFLSHFPVAGVAWQTVHYLIGLQRLGYEVYYVEAHGCTPSKLMRSESDDGPARAAGYIENLMRRFDLQGRWAYHAIYEGRCFGMSETQLKELYRSAALLINLHGSHLPRPELTAANRLVYVGTDPVDIEIDVFNQKQEAIDYLQPHCAFFTYGENLGHPDCRVPQPAPFEFRATRQPVVMDFWESHGVGEGALFTTIGNWRQPWREVRFQGERYTWSKHLEFLKFLDLPRRLSQPFELALSSCETQDRRLLEDHGWRVRPALELSQDLDAYRRYLGQSRGEFTVAKDQNVRLRSGWFSDRAATYLAAGRPVINQETGFSNLLPTGEGLFAFSTLEEIVAAVEAVNADYERQRRAARRIARECFSHEVVLGKMLGDVGLVPRRERALKGVFQTPTAAPGSSAGFQPAVSPTSSRQTVAPSPASGGLETRDTAGWKPALQGRGPLRAADGSETAGGGAVVEASDRPVAGSEPDAPLLAPTLVLAPTGRWPTRLPEATVEAAMSLPLPVARAPEPNAGPTTSIVVVTCNGLPYTKMCLASLFGPGWRAGDEVIVVDNASSDGTPAFLRELEQRNPCVRAIFNLENRGFAAANNQGLALARGQILILLNNDTLTPGGWRDGLAGWLADPAIGLVGPVTNRTCNEAQIDAPYRTLEEMERFARDYVRQHRGQGLDLPMLAMFCLALRREVYEKVGPLDESFGVGMFEDDDYARRASQAGYRVVCAEDVFVHHFGQASLGELCASGEYDRLLAANRRRFEEKWGVRWQPHGRRHSPEYQGLRARIHECVGRLVPAGATVAVISKGDEELLKLQDRRGWHFPRAADGQYPSLYPAHSAEAIAHLEELRAQGAGFLLIPKPALWWLEHYGDFKDHLQKRYPLLARDPEICFIYELGGNHGA
jgi:GT2 family glycosyltransferase